MNALKKFFGKLAGSRMKTYCSCGHAVSANLAFCPHCGRRLSNHSDYPID